ncbi:hypothetical protein MRX96_029589 [Rhipicephalus microplus]
MVWSVVVIGCRQQHTRALTTLVHARLFTDGLRERKLVPRRSTRREVAFGDLNPFPMRVINAKRVQHMQAVKEQLRKLDEIRNSLPTRKVQECGSPELSDDPSK